MRPRAPRTGRAPPRRPSAGAASRSSLDRRPRQAVGRAVQQSNRPPLRVAVESQQAVAMHMGEARDHLLRAWPQDPLSVAQGGEPVTVRSQPCDEAIEQLYERLAADSLRAAARAEQRSQEVLVLAPLGYHFVTRTLLRGAPAQARRGIQAEPLEQAGDREHREQLAVDNDRPRELEPYQLAHRTAVHAEDGLRHLHAVLPAVALELSLVGVEHERPARALVDQPRHPPVEPGRELPRERLRVASETDAQVVARVSIADEEPVVREASGEHLRRELAEPAPDELIGHHAPGVELRVQPVATGWPRTGRRGLRHERGRRAAVGEIRAVPMRRPAGERNGEPDEKTFPGAP